MSKTDRSAETSSSDSTEADDRRLRARGVTDGEREALLKDAKAFKEAHDRTFRILSNG